MISFGAVLGKATPGQLLWLVLLEVPIYAFNQKLVFDVFKGLDIGMSRRKSCWAGLALGQGSQLHSTQLSSCGWIPNGLSSDVFLCLADGCSLNCALSTLPLPFCCCCCWRCC